MASDSAKLFEYMTLIGKLKVHDTMFGTISKNIPTMEAKKKTRPTGYDEDSSKFHRTL